LAARPHQAPAIGRQLAELRGSDTAADDGLGSPVTISGATAIVGAWRHAKHGSAYVFTEANGVWKQTAELNALHTAAGEGFGSSAAISGSTAIIGASGYGNDGGRAYVFTEIEGTWKQVAELKGSDTYDGIPCTGDLCSGGSFFGTSVAIWGGTAIVGATEQAKEAGRAYVFTDTRGSWRQTAELMGSTAHLGAQFGTSVAISGTTAVIGADGDPTGGGRAYVFNETNGGWTQVAVLKGADTAMNDYFGSAVALSGTTIIVGAYGHADLAGRAYVFAKIKGVWKQVAELGTDTAVYGGLFGDSVAIGGSQPDYRVSLK
jgi:hypothetical protein